MGLRLERGSAAHPNPARLRYKDFGSDLDKCQSLALVCGAGYRLTYRRQGSTKGFGSVSIDSSGGSVPQSLADVIDTEPWDLYERLQGEGVVWDDTIDGFLIGSYDLVRSTLRQDNNVFHNPMGDRAATDPHMVAIHRSPRDIRLIYGEDHHRFHSWWYRALSRTTCERWRPTRIRPIVNAVIDRFAVVAPLSSGPSLP